MSQAEPSIPAPTPEQRRAAVGQFERAQQVVARGEYDYAIQLLLSCCKIDPANLIYRRALRQVEKNKYKNNLRGSTLAIITTSAARARLKSAKRARDYLKVLEYGEEVLTKNPWDIGAQMDMAAAAEMLNLMDVAVWILEQARQKDPKNATVNRTLARLYEKRGNFTQAIQLWELVKEADPRDVEAHHKAKDLAASDTIIRGNYEQVVTGEQPSLPTQKPQPGGQPDTPEVPSTEAEAQTLYSKALADPTNPAPWLNLVNYFRKADRFEEARRALQDGLKATGNHFDLSAAAMELDIAAFQRDLDLTLAKLQEKPDDEALLEIRDRLIKEINSLELELYRKKADRYPTDRQLRFELGVRLLRAGQLDEAIRELQALRTDSRFQWKALMYLGYCFKNRKNWRLAQRNFEEALQQLPAADTENRKAILYELAKGYATAGDLNQAIDLAHDLANIDFNYRDIGKLLDEWENRVHESRA
ncbi:MAG: hypothetical protein KatS3mg105_0565 [Gemmatales bacterium]|nr:MAG: hypothetical protein KatS3mg105_0565 [Gemmatales bacterium]